jgi:hypothetical protein
MQLVGLAQEMAAAQKQARNSAHRLPRSGATLVHDWLTASNVSASATVPPAASEEELPVPRQNVPAQETAFIWAGFPMAGSSKSGVHDFPFHSTATAFWIGSCESVKVPTPTQFVALAHETLDRPHGPGAPPQNDVFFDHTCQVLPFHERTTPPKIIMHSVRVPQDTPATPPFGLGIVRHVLPFQRSAPVGPPDAMQNQGAEQDTLVSDFPGGFRSVRQLVPFQVIACACRTLSVVTYVPTAMHQDGPLQETDARLAWPPKLAGACRAVPIVAPVAPDAVAGAEIRAAAVAAVASAAAR